LNRVGIAFHLPYPLRQVDDDLLSAVDCF
jgi:hypothetical protein